jgi:hypothetical protein
MILLSDLTKEILAVCPIYGLTLNDDGSVFVDYDPSALPAQIASADNLLATNSGQIVQTIPIGALTSGCITGELIADHAINASKIAPGSLSADMFTSGSIDPYILASGSVFSDNIASGQLHTYHLASGEYFAPTIENPFQYGILTSLSSGSNGILANDNLTYDGSKFTLNSTSSGSTVFEINGSAGNIMQINDLPTADYMFEVANNYSGTFFGVSRTGHIKNWTSIFSGQQSFFTAFSVNMNEANAAMLDYFVKNTDAGSSRAGTLNLVWDESSQIIEFNEIATQDIGGITDNLYFNADIVLGQAVVQASISSGTWNGRIGARVL